MADINDGKEFCQAALDVVKESLEGKNVKIDMGIDEKRHTCEIYIINNDEVELAYKRHLGHIDAESFIKINYKDKSIERVEINRVLPDKVESIDFDL